MKTTEIRFATEQIIKTQKCVVLPPQKHENDRKYILVPEESIFSKLKMPTNIAGDIIRIFTRS